MKYYFSFVLLLSTILLMSAQQSAEVSLIYQLEATAATSFAYPCISSSQTVPDCYTEQLKNDLLQTEDRSDLSLWNSLQQHIEDGLLLTINAESGQVISADSAIALTVNLNDTVTTYHPSTYEKVVKIIEYPSPIFHYNIRQQLTITENRLNCQITSITPMTYKDSVLTNTFTIPLRESSEHYTLNHSDVTWVKLTKVRANLDAIGLSRRKLKTMLWDNPKKGVTSIYNAEDGVFSTRRLSEDYFPSIETSRVDTITTFDPDTYKEYIRTVAYEGVTFEDISEVDIYQIWYYSHKTGVLQNQILAIAPRILFEHSKNKWYDQGMYLLKFDHQNQ